MERLAEVDSEWDKVALRSPDIDQENSPLTGRLIYHTYVIRIQLLIQ